MALKWKSEFLFISPWLLIASSESERREESHETEKERSFTGFMLKPEWDFDLIWTLGGIRESILKY